LDDDVDIGPLTTEQQLKAVIATVEDAKKKGAKIAIGGRVIENGGFFFEPTVLTHVNHSMNVMVEETFGPILPIMTVDSVDEAIALANDCRYGLSAYGWTSSRITAERFQRELEAGTVMINDSVCTWGESNAPWGGMKQSGIGRTRSQFGLMEMVQVKYTSYDKGNNDYNPWWFPYNQSARHLGDQAIKLLFAKNLRGKVRPLIRLLKNERFLKTAQWTHIFRNLKKLL
jgi:acyl-CoA reductase-like NAD-dependent aldehyde dehydrogenase